MNNDAQAFVEPGELVDTLRRVIDAIRVATLAMKGANFDGAEELCRVLYRQVEDPLYALVERMETDRE